MKKYVLFLVLLFPLCTFAQFKLAANAGANYAGLHVIAKGNSTNTSKGVGWQAGLYTEYKKQQWFLYSGINFMQYNFSIKHFYFANDYYNYHPLYLQMPVGIGYYLRLHKNSSLKMYGGVQGMLGIGGKLTAPVYGSNCDPAACFLPDERLTKDIQFGYNKYVNSNESFTKTSANMQVGAAINLSKKAEAGISYAWGITDVRNLKDNYAGKTHLNSRDVTVKYYLLSK